MYTEGKAHRLVNSSERSTGMGATRYSAVLTTAGDWVPVSRCPGVRYHGRYNGVETYSVQVDADLPWAEFYRSNSGRELVKIHDPSRDIANPTTQEVASFEDADRWAWTDEPVKP